MNLFCLKFPGRNSGCQGDSKGKMPCHNSPFEWKREWQTQIEETKPISSPCVFFSPDPQGSHFGSGNTETQAASQDLCTCLFWTWTSQAQSAVPLGAEVSHAPELQPLFFCLQKALCPEFSRELLCLYT